MVVHGIECANIGVAILVEARNDFVRCGREMFLHQVNERGARPVRVGLAQEVGDVDGVLLPFGVGLLLRSFVSRFGPLI
jgi:hypothetical protein